MVEILALKRVLIDGTLLSLGLGIIIIGSLMYNARLWLKDYPKPIQDKVPPLTSAEKRDRNIVAMLFFVATIGILTISALQLRAEGNGSLSFGMAYVNLFVVMMMFNLFDAVVIDLLLITFMRPKFVIIPGMEGMEYLFHDYKRHFTDFLKGTVFCTVFSVPFAMLTVV